MRVLYRMSTTHPIHAKLKAIPLFHDFTDPELAQFLDLADPTAYDPGEFIMRQGESGNCMFYVAEGHCRVVARQGGDLVELAMLGPGDIVGELAMFDHQPRCADVLAAEPAILLKVNEGVLRALAGLYPGAAFKFLIGIVREMGLRLRQSNARYLDSLLNAWSSPDASAKG
jgi:CRP/FNR family transcriptional regulator, cyclic AMP receptor protein